MKDTSKKRLVIRLTTEQQTDLKNALGIEKPCEFIEIALPKGTKRSIDEINSAAIATVYGILTPGLVDWIGTVMIID